MIDVKDNYYLDIISLLDKYVKKIAKAKYAEDITCPPQFWVSLLGDKGEDQKILLSISHMGFNFSSVIFPQPYAEYGYESLEQEMEWLYGRTM